MISYAWPIARVVPIFGIGILRLFDSSLRTPITISTLLGVILVNITIVTST